MLTKWLVMLHVLGAAVWIGGHAVVLAVVIPAARRSRDVGPVREFERAFGKLARASLGTQVLTGAILASPWIGGWGNVLSTPTPVSHLVLGKIALVAAIVGLAAHASRRMLPALTPATLGRFALHAWIVTVLSILLVVSGVSIRFGGIF
jgi:putative copper export protein